MNLYLNPNVLGVRNVIYNQTTDWNYSEGFLLESTCCVLTREEKSNINPILIQFSCLWSSYFNPILIQY